MMDPNAALDLILDKDTDHETRKDAAEGLATWLHNGGFMPKKWKKGREELMEMCFDVMNRKAPKASAPVKETEVCCTVCGFSQLIPTGTCMSCPNCGSSGGCG